MAYESPIKIDREYSITNDAEEICRKIMKDEEVYIMYQVNLVVDVDKDELLKALQYDRDQYEKGYADGRRARDAEIVRCKDCIYNYGGNCDAICETLEGDLIGVTLRCNDDFYCAYGERREDGLD